MMRLTPGPRAIVLSASLAFATTAFAGAAGTDEATEGPAAAPATTTVQETVVEKPFRASINIGPQAGYAFQDSGDFGWAVDVLARLHKYGGIQLEYWSLGNRKGKGGAHFDGLYAGVMPILPIPGVKGLDLFAQVGGAFSDYGDDVAAGGGILYELPIEFLNANNVDLLLRLDYKYFAIGGEDHPHDGQHLLTFGFMVGFHK